jgi:hypothetical protein
MFDGMFERYGRIGQLYVPTSSDAWKEYSRDRVREEWLREMLPLVFGVYAAVPGDEREIQEAGEWDPGRASCRSFSSACVEVVPGTR